MSNAEAVAPAPMLDANQVAERT